MREEPGQTCMESTNNSNETTDDISDSKEETGNNKSQPTNVFDDSCFKTPELPNRRRKMGVARINGHINDNLSLWTNGKSESIESLKKLTLTPTATTLDGVDDSNADESKTSIENSCEFKPSTSGSSDDDATENRSHSPLKSPTKISSKGSSYTCPHTKRYLSTTYPKLSSKSLSDKELDLLNEIIIDEFSLLVFKSLDDYKVFKIEDDEKMARDKVIREKMIEDEAKKKAEDPILLTPCAKNSLVPKKKGRKSKAEKAKEEEERRRVKAERKEQRKRERRERRIKERQELRTKGLAPKRKERRTEEEKQRILEEKQKHKEAKRLERERLKEEKRHLKRQLKISDSSSAAGPSSSAAAFCFGSADAIRNPHHHRHTTNQTGVIVSANLSSQPYSGLMMKNTIENLVIASAKRPTSDIGDIHGRNGVIFPPSATPPAAKIPKLEDSLEEFKKHHHLIGIAVKSENNFDQNVTPPSGVVANGLTKTPLSTIDFKAINGAQLPNDPSNRGGGLIGQHTTTPSSTAGSNSSSSLPILERHSSSSSLNLPSTSTSSSLASITASQSELRAQISANQALAAAIYGNAGLPSAELQAALMNHPEFAAQCRQAYAALASTGNSPMHALLMPGIGLPPSATPGFPGGFASLFGPQLYDHQQRPQQTSQLAAQRSAQATSSANNVQQQPSQQQQQQPQHNGLPPMLGSASTSSNASGTQALSTAGLNTYPQLNIQFPPNAALGSQLAGAALLSGLNPTPVKTSKWCNMHVLIAESVLKKKDGLKNSSVGVSAASQINRVRTPPLRNNILPSTSLASNSVQLSQLQKNAVTDSRFAQFSQQQQHQQQQHQQHQQQQQQALLAAAHRQSTAASLMQPPTSKPAQQPPPPLQLNQQRPTIQQSPQQQQQQSVAQYQQAMLLQQLQQQQAMSVSNHLASTTMTSSSAAASLAQQQARKTSQVLPTLQQIQANSLMTHFGLQPGITSGIPPSMMTSHPLAASQELAKVAGRTSATPKQLNSMQQAALARPPSSINHQSRAASTAPSVAQHAAAALHPALGAIGLQQSASSNPLGGIPAGFPIVSSLGPSGSLTNGTSDAAVQAMIAAALNPATGSSANAAALAALISQATGGGNNLSAMQTLSSHALGQSVQQQRSQETQQQASLAAALIQQMQMIEKQQQLQSALPNGSDLLRQIEQHQILQQLQHHQFLDRYANTTNLLTSALQHQQQQPAQSSSAEQLVSVSLANGLHTQFEQELMRQRLAQQLRPNVTVASSQAAASLGLHGLGQSLHQNHAQQNVELVLLEQLQRQQQQQQQAMLGRSMMGAGLAPTAQSPAPSMMFNPQFMSNPMAAQLYGKMNSSMNAAAAASKREN